MRRDELVNLITSGIIREYNYTDYISPMEYDKFNKSINNAFKYRKDKLEGADRDMKVYYIFGESGCGKTSYAKQLARDKDYSYYVSSGSNDLLDNYRGQDCLILDDIRPGCIEVSDFLKLLDNHTQSTVKSRYRNKMLECQLVIITTSMSLERFFVGLLGDTAESFMQLKRRIEFYCEMSRDNITLRIWQPRSQKYVFAGSYENPMKGKYIVSDRSQEDISNYVSESFGLVKNPDDGFRPCTDEERDIFVKQLELKEI